MKSTATVGRRPSPMMLAILISLSIGGLMSSDINLPGMSMTAASLGVPVSAVQASFGPYLVGLLVAQLFYGPLSDARGRRVPIIVGFSVYALASLACAFPANITVFTVARLLQALGAGAGLVVARAVIGDLYDRETAARVLGLIMPWMGSSPAFAPFIGGYLTEWFSWRAPFLFTAVLAAVTVVAVLFRLPESRPRTARTGHLRETIGNYRTLFGSVVFWRYGLNLTMGYAVYTGYLVGSPAIFHRLGVSPVANGYCYILMSIAFISGNLVSRRLVRSTPIDELLTRAHVIFSGGALAFLLFSLYSPLNFWPMIFMMAVVNVGNGFIFPLSVAGGVTTFPAFPGVASGLLGAFQMGGGGVASLIVSVSPKDSRSMSMLVTACAIAGLAAFLALRRSARPYSRMPATPLESR
ncbi:multidrug effflux MFS transporter [Planotetraspora mira]|uniref:Bcr/CflA family drug resistance efflux transporter n=1 Tax=Planotetraspora mira TaxID=58121 RepID=A0A8J3TMX1_9ACTN|nr:multidrug effflux MFS transporter [Planotetraspora mira]GII28741.1 Bcr/CflA family drug resistance efflux transporter [Planotetraspora mira]